MIAFNRSSITEKEKDYVLDSINTNHLHGDGKYTKLVKEWFEERINSKVLLTTSCTAALEMSAILCDIKPGDEVIVPSYTFVSSINAFVLRGAIPVFVEIDPKTMNIDVKKIEEKITNKTKAIIIVDYAGVVPDMDYVNKIAKKHNLFVVEDAAQAVGSYYKDKSAGTLADFGCYSFHDTKNYTMGEGGAFITNYDDKLLSAEIIREKGTNRTQFTRGIVDKYNWCSLGSSYLPSDILSALLYGQLNRFDEIMEKRMNIWNYYHKNLKELETKKYLTRQYIPKNCKHNAHMYYIILKDKETKSALEKYFKENGIQTNSHYYPLHISPMGKTYGYKEGDLPLTEDYALRLLRLPLYADLTLEEAEKVCKTLKEFFKENN